MKIIIRENDIVLGDIPVLNRLLRQMSPNASIVRFKLVEEIMKTSMILTLRDPVRRDVLIGMGTLAPVRKLSYLCGSIEDIVVDEQYRGKGLGRKIMEILMDKAGALGMKYVALTSSPKRVGANRLYQSLGFEKPGTNLYRFYFK